MKEFSDDKIALVETSDGFDMPMLVTDLIVDEAVSYDGDNTDNDTNKTASDSEMEAPQVSFEEKKFQDFEGRFLLALVPENDQILHVSDFGLYAINDSNYYFNCTASLKDSGVSFHITNEIIEPDTKLELARYSQSDLAKIREFRIQGIFYKPGLFKVVEPVDLVFSIENVSFYKGLYFKDNDYFHQKAYMFEKAEETKMEEAVNELKEKDWSVIIEDKEKPEKQPIKKSHKNFAADEIDLHIEELVEDHENLSNSEILNIQLSRFEIALETAIRSEARKIVFIHGVGNGVLKHEINKKLKKEYPDLRSQDASFKEYGYGATMVYLK